ncbi:MAG: hypothetical protein WC842_03460 [Candidatus Paceibacterota bacterium]|jgi:hypothetical protein
MRNTKKAFLWIIDILEQHKILYRISGGLAARAYGVDRELADIDVEIASKDFSYILKNVGPYIIFGPTQSKDKNWDLKLMTLLYDDQKIDISESEAKFFNKKIKQWENCSSDLRSRNMVDIYGKVVPVEPIESLIAYKTKLAREVDLEDVRQLNKIINHSRIDM